MSRQLTLAAVFIFITITIFGTTAYASGRQTISLDGTWQITQGDLSDNIPQTFDRTIPVPGLVDLARPEFTEVGVDSSQRKAFWYRRTFTVNSPKRQTAMLKVTKAQFGIKVWLNGILLGEHMACFTPGYFDVSNLVKYGDKNTLIIRVGAYKNSVPPQIPTNTDYEQLKWIPGIYDTVSLLLMDNPYIKSVQVAPHIKDGTATVQVIIQNTGKASVSNLKLSIKEWKSGKNAAKPTIKTIQINQSGDQVITTRMKLNKTHLWSPEDPFLYTLHCETDGDSVDTRFGMREFGFDAATGRAMLNGKPYYMRGTNFCIFRFFEDPKRGSLLWNRTWVRKLLTTPKQTMHWNSARVCIAPFPEFWYDIADETGWLLQDEFPIWGFNDVWSQSELESQFRAWVTERRNHPSIAIWDACNETLTPRTGQLISAVRGMDLSNRPWDDGYSPKNRPNDPSEFHPYSTFPLWTGEGWDPSNLGDPSESPFTLPVSPLIFNEYDAFWMQRDGKPTIIFDKFYNDRVGVDASPEERRELQAYYGAAVTEFWRATRKAAAVMWFCYLTYSKTNVVTGDNFIDLKNQTMSPEFVDYMSNAFAPLAVMINDLEPRIQQNTSRNYKIIITNDMDTAQSGNVTLNLIDPENGKSLNTQNKVFSVKPLGQSIIYIKMPIPDIHGKYRLQADLTTPKGYKVRSRRNIDVLTADEMEKIENIAKGCRTTASSWVHDERGKFPASNATDGKPATRWSSEFSDPQWLMIDLGREQTVGHVKLSWEFAHGREYKIQVSKDMKTWEDAYYTNQGKGAIEDILFQPKQARYIRLQGITRGTRFGYSIFEFQVFSE
ncbi:MAG: glycoside hydrolase family 2 protein [Armatimonadota bacterium]